MYKTEGESWASWIVGVSGQWGLLEYSTPGRLADHSIQSLKQAPSPRELTDCELTSDSNKISGRADTRRLRILVQEPARIVLRTPTGTTERSDANST